MGVGGTAKGGLTCWDWGFQPGVCRFPEDPCLLRIKGDACLCVSAFL